MRRALVTVRDATPDDLPDVLTLWREYHEFGSRAERAAVPPSRDDVLERLRRVQDHPDARLVVALVGESAAGMVVLTCEPLAALFDQRAVHMHYLHVREGCRRRGVGHALVAAAASYAEERGVEHVVTGVSPQLRDANRFYARLGFGPMVVRRVAPVAALRRKLTADAHPVRQGALEDLMARRRSVRTRTRAREALARVAD